MQARQMSKALNEILPLFENDVSRKHGDAHHMQEMQLSLTSWDPHDTLRSISQRSGPLSGSITGSLQAMW